MKKVMSLLKWFETISVLGFNVDKNNVIKNWSFGEAGIGQWTGDLFV